MPTENQSHTPTPWNTGSGDCFTIYSRNGDTRGRKIAIVLTQDGATDFDGPTALADAKFIVRACNSHAALVEALIGLEEYVEEYSEKNNNGLMVNAPAMLIARAALKIATE